MTIQPDDGARLRTAHSVGPVTIGADAVATADESWKCVDANGDRL